MRNSSLASDRFHVSLFKYILLGCLDTMQSFLTNIIITESLIIDSIKELSSNSAAGPDGIPASLLLNCASELAPPLLILFKQSLDSSVIDPSFKKAAIVPVFQSDDRTVPHNYRHISLASVIIKVFE